MIYLGVGGQGNHERERERELCVTSLFSQNSYLVIHVDYRTQEGSVTIFLKVKGNVDQASDKNHS